jgi:hypothetical protein
MNLLDITTTMISVACVWCITFLTFLKIGLVGPEFSLSWHVAMYCSTVWVTSIICYTVWLFSSYLLQKRRGLQDN